ncbi:MAG: hypothetical protein JW864_17495 [Spirochaetes bacterium]|nr:hypothetical protein [Spirochaetota bacterium]
MSSDNIDDILSDIDDEGGASEVLKDLQKDKGKPLSSPVEHLKAKLENKLEEDISFLYEVDSQTSDVNASSDIDSYTEIPVEDIGEDEQKNNAEIEQLQKGLSSEKKITGIKPAELKVKGTRTWNTREPYTAPVNTDALKTDYEDLHQSFFFIKSNVNESEIIGEMKRTMFKFMRGSSRDILNDYSDFIYKIISDTTAKLCKDFNFSENVLPFFVYHLGVFTLYNVVIDYLKANKAGFCFKLSSESKVMRYIPSEFVKEMTIKWHNDHIFPEEFSFDGILEFNELKRKISELYTDDIENKNHQIDVMIEKSNAESVSRIEREKIFKSKWTELFGRDRIIVYNRFLERTVFKGKA